MICQTQILLNVIKIANNALMVRLYYSFKIIRDGQFSIIYVNLFHVAANSMFFEYRKHYKI